MDNPLDAVRGWWGARVILSAVELDLFKFLLAEPVAAHVVAERADTDERATGMLLDALASMQVLLKEEERYQVVASLRESLSEEHDLTVMPYLRHAVAMWKRWSRLSDVVRTGDIPEDAAAAASAPEDFIGAMRVIARERADTLTAEVDLEGVETLLDLGGGPGSYAISYANRKPGLLAVVFDLPHVAEIAEENIRHHKMEDRISTMGGDYLHDSIDGPYDLIWISSIVHMHDERENQQLVDKAAASLNPGGRLIIRDFLLNEDGGGPPSAALFAINMLVATAGGRSYKASEIMGWMEQAGLQNVQVKRLADDGLVIGVK